MSQQLLEDVTRAYLGAKIQGVHLNNYHLHGLSYNHQRDIEQKLGLAPHQQQQQQAHNTDHSEGAIPGGANDRLGVSPFPASVRSSTSDVSTAASDTPQRETKKRSPWPMIGAATGALLLGTAGGAIGSKMLGGTPPAVQQKADPPPVSEYEIRTGHVDLEVR